MYGMILLILIFSLSNYFANYNRYTNNYFGYFAGSHTGYTTFATPHTVSQTSSNTYYTNSSSEKIEEQNCSWREYCRGLCNFSNWWTGSDNGYCTRLCDSLVFECKGTCAFVSWWTPWDNQKPAEDETCIKQCIERRFFNGNSQNTGQINNTTANSSYSNYSYSQNQNYYSGNTWTYQNYNNYSTNYNRNWNYTSNHHWQ